MSQNYQNVESTSNAQPESINLARYVANRNVLDLTTLTVGEMVVLCVQPPNQIGVIVAIFIAYAFTNTLSIFETVMMPILVKNETIDVTIHSHFGYPLLMCVSVTSALSFYAYRRFLGQSALPSISDRSFIFVSLIFGILGCLLLFRFNGLDLGTSIGFSLIGISLIIGIKSVLSMYTKIVGVAFGSTKISETGNGVSLYDRQKSVGWYLGLAMAFTVVFRILTPHINSFLLLHGGPKAAFIHMLILYVLSFLLLISKMNSLKPHYSYLIVKQKEMVTKGINEKDMRLLDTVEYVTSTPSL